ncbi:hypothetical protein [Kurthia senegalensis]|uniref:hypothetical protein n=1 Tax=Kurthia senegalensis TaxID=1033740 RepID=UPI0002882059|nr:hypothetical protein [Kurthia senegalensis]
MKKVWIILSVVIVILVIMLGGWQLKKDKQLNVVIVNKTVPSTDYTEHLGLNWLLHAEKVVKKDGRAYSLTDYYGYHPESSPAKQRLPKNYDDTNLIYLADSYGVYNNEGTENPELIDGGLSMDEWDPIFKRLKSEKPVTLVTEFNTLAAPTTEEVHEHMSSVLSVQTTGWIGRHFSNLSLDDEDMPKWLRQSKEAKKDWSYEGSGYLLVNEEKETYFVLEDGEDVSDTLRIQFTEVGQKQFGQQSSVAFNGWFDIVEGESERSIIANFDWSLTKKGEALLKKHSVPKKFVAVTKTTMGQATAYYFAGQFNVTPKVPKYDQYLGVETINKWVSHYSKETGFYWDAYVPMMRQILSETNEQKSKKVAIKKKPETVQYTARIHDQDMEVLVDNEWKSMKIQGVNLGMGKPGTFPGQAAITENEYYKWLIDIGKLGSNTIRVYTVQPPGFYNALKRYNESHDSKLYLLHGTWVEEERLVKTGNAHDQQVTNDAQIEMKHIVNIIHGNEMLSYHKGHATGAYTADISKYVIGWIVGIEWDPEMVASTNKKNKDVGDYNGQYVYSKGASPFEHWIAAQIDYIATYEKQTYNWIRPISFTNWVTTDLLNHPEEPDPKEDLVSVNPNFIHVKKDLKKTEQFASYHVYPYYPESLNYQYADYVDYRGEKNNYAGYLKELHAAHKMPVLIAEFGIPSSRGKTHNNVYGWNQGHMSEKAQGETLAHLFEDILHEDLMGGLIFTWQDEWFKRTWNTMDLDNPDRRPYWSNAQTSEQQFGLLSFDRLKVKVDGRDDDWEGVQSLYTSNGAVQSLMMQNDERYVYYKIQLSDQAKGYPMLLIDTKQGQGNTKVNGYGLKTANGLEFIAPLKSAKNSRVLVDTQYDIYALYYEKYDAKNIHYDGTANTGNFTKINYVLSNQLKIPTTKQTIPFVGYETGKLLEGNANPNDENYNSLVDFNINEDEHFIELRIPWLLLSFADPSLKEVVGDISKKDYMAREKVKGIQVGVAFMDEHNKVIETLPAMKNGKVPALTSYTWANWEQPESTYRLKQSYAIVQNVFKQNKKAFIEKE